MLLSAVRPRPRLALDLACAAMTTSAANTSSSLAIRPSRAATMCWIRGPFDCSTTWAAMSQSRKLAECGGWVHADISHTGVNRRQPHLGVHWRSHNIKALRGVAASEGVAISRLSWLCQTDSWKDIYYRMMQGQCCDCSLVFQYWEIAPWYWETAPSKWGGAWIREDPVCIEECVWQAIVYSPRSYKIPSTVVGGILRIPLWNKETQKVETVSKNAFIQLRETQKEKILKYN